MKRHISLALTSLLLLSSINLVACTDTTSTQTRDENVLRVASWDEYIDMGGEDSYYSADARPLYEEFEDWYKETYGKTIKVEYIALQDNETMYSKIKMGDSYDLLCPSEYMIMKLATEDKLKPFPESFFDESLEHNYFAKNLSPYIKEVFENGKLSNGASWADYAAGYMWGSTGFVFNPEEIDRSIMTSWNCLTAEECERKITAKDNVRDSYFMGLGMYYENELLSLKDDYTAEKITKAQYRTQVDSLMNDTSVETMGKVNQLGSLDEVLALCTVDKRILPCIDFGHLNARDGGIIKGKDDYLRIIDRMAESLKDDRFMRFHSHFSKIEYTTGGEKRHLTFVKHIIFTSVARQ